MYCTWKGKILQENYTNSNGNNNIIMIFTIKELRVYSPPEKGVFQTSIGGCRHHLLLHEPPTPRTCWASRMPPVNVKINNDNNRENYKYCRAFCGVHRSAGTLQIQIVQELLVKSVLIGRWKQWHVILSIVSVLFGVRVRNHWWLLFRAAATTSTEEFIYIWKQAFGKRCKLGTKPYLTVNHDLFFVFFPCFVSIFAVLRFPFELHPLERP